MTLKQIGDWGAAILGHTADNIIKERIKDAFKRLMANRIRQSTEKNGLDDMFKISFDVTLVPFTSNFKGVRTSPYKHIDYYHTINKLPYPVRFPNDAPFTYIGYNGFSCKYVNESELRQIERPSPLGSSLFGGYSFYMWKNRYIYIIIDKRNPNSLYLQTCAKNNVNSIRVESIFPDPETLMEEYTNTNDGQEIVVPFADDMVENILYEILKTEYHYVPKETIVTINPNNNTNTVPGSS